MLEITRLLLLCAAGTLLFLLVRVSLRNDWPMRAVIVACFLGRAFLSQVLFWIPYLKLPVARSLQLEDGLWFFAVDSRLYIDAAKKASAAGFPGIVALTSNDPSASYVQFLALFTYLFGQPIAVSLLLNLFCYAGACAVITLWAQTSPKARNASFVALAAISLSPSAALWSMQPLKDTFFQFLIVAFFGACFLWQRAWRAENLHKQAWWAGAAIIAVHFLISGVRWYVGFMMFAAMVLILPVIALTLHRRRLLGAVAAVAVLVILSRSYLLASGRYLPPPVKDLLSLKTPFSAGAAPLVGQVDRIRGGFERTQGNTQIRVGKARATSQPETSAPQTATAPPPQVAAAPATPRTTEPKQARVEPVRKPSAAPAPAVTKPAPRVAETPRPQPSTPPPAGQRPATPAPVAVANNAPAPEQVEEPTRAEKLLAGAVAATLPQAISSRLGLVEIGSGRGFAWFAEIDTLIFDTFLVIALFSVVLGFRGAAPRNGVFWLVLAVTGLMAIGLFYTVTNFGTLFRHRLMIMTAFSLIPLALATAPARQQAAAPPAPESAPALEGA